MPSEKKRLLVFTSVTTQQVSDLTDASQFHGEADRTTRNAVKIYISFESNIGALKLRSPWSSELCSVLSMKFTSSALTLAVSHSGSFPQ